MSTAIPAQDAAPHNELEERVTPLELFFDLVFVFGLTQVTLLMSTHTSLTGLAQGLAVLTVLWWAWAAYSWLTNEIDTEETPVRLALFASMAAMLIAALAVPDAFGDDALIFGCAYLAVRLLHVLLFVQASRDVNAAQAIRNLSATAIPAPALLVVAAFLGGTVQAVVWALAIVIDLAGPYWRGVEGFRVSAGYFAERFGLIIIIALGESIVAIGVGAGGVDLDAGIIAAALLSIAITASLWWAYFDVVAVVAEFRFRAAAPAEQVRMARDSYSYLHLPMIAGIVLVALGIKKTLAHVDEPLKVVAAVALCGGVALYLAGHIGFRLRNVHTVNRQRVVTAILALALIPLAHEVDALVALAVVSALCCGLIAYEAIRFADSRANIRAEYR